MSEIRTARLWLRPFTPADVPAYAAIRAQPEVARFLPRREGVSPQQVGADTVAAFGQCWRAQGYGPWAAVELVSGRLIGHLGVRYMPEFGETEILYALDRNTWGSGLATEGAAAARDYAFATLRLERVMAIALPENTASRRVMSKIGLTFEKTASYKGLDVVYYGLTRVAWQQSGGAAGERPS